jgi:DNA-binding MarR family transcriptional regulator
MPHYRALLVPTARPTKSRPLEPALAFLQELWALDHALGSTSKRMLDRMGITAEQRMVLRFVGKFPEMTAGELAALLHVEKSTLSLALKRLAEKGLVERRRDERDARKSHVVLTVGGRKFDRPTVGTVERAVQRALRATKPADVALVRSFLRQLVKFLSEGATERA